MTGNYHVGDNVTQYGDHNVGMIKNQAPTDPQTAFRDMVEAIHTLRAHVAPADRQSIDDSLRTIQSSDTNTNKDTLRRALANVAGIATVVGQVGVPVIESIRKVMTALGM